MGSTLSTRVFCLRWFTFGCMSLLFVPVQAFSMDKSGNVCVTRDGLTGDQFRSVMQQIADGWNEGDASKAAECFAEDAIYSAPPAKGHHGRGDLYEFFGGEKRRPFPMHMKWHHLLLNRSEQIGVGEYTFRYKVQTHGIVIVKLTHGRISHWREYEVKSRLPWEQFLGDNTF